MPYVDVVVTNGGYGGVQRCLTAGVPMVVAGDTEEKPEVAAHVGWSGAGINLKTGPPAPDKIAAGVRRVLQTPSYSANARRLQEEFSRTDALASIEAVARSSVTARPSGPQNPQHCL